MNMSLDKKNPKNNSDLKIVMRNKTKREICTVKNRSKTELNIEHEVLYNQCFSGNDFPSQYEEECPVNYSLKYSETESCKINKAEEKFKFAEYAETDLDQPTDFSLKYGESNGEEVKPSNFNYYERTKPKTAECFNAEAGPDVIITRERGRETYSCENETPLMFSRCSSFNSLSSFEHITQSIPDDRSSIVSEFSRTTSGIISPSELPDSPTQTAPSSPKRNKSVGFPLHGFLREKKSVFEDDVATYKQEDTPIEFSCSTSLSSLNISVKAEFNLKTNSKASSITGGDDVKPKDESQFESVANDKFDIKEEEFVANPENQNANNNKNTSLNEVDGILLEKMNTIRIDDKIDASHLDKMNNTITGENSQNYTNKTERSQHKLPNAEFAVKSGISPVFSNPNYEASDDDVHTYHTEGTPANISHAGSQSDLTTLNIIAGISLSGTANNSDSDSDREEVLLSECNRIEVLEINEGSTFKSLDEETSEPEAIFPKSCTPLEEALVEQCIRLGMPQKINSKKLDDSIKPLETKGIDNWCAKSCTPLEEALVEQCIRLGMPRKNKKLEIAGSTSLNQRHLMKSAEQSYYYHQKNTNQMSQYSHSKLPNTEMQSISYEPRPLAFLPSNFSSFDPEVNIRTQSLGIPSTNFTFNNSCTFLEDALVEHCIRLGMSQKSASKMLGGNVSKLSGSYEEPRIQMTTSNSFINKSKINQGSSNLNINQEKETSKKLDRFICNTARKLITKRKKSKETCRKCKKCREKSKGGL